MDKTLPLVELVIDENDSLTGVHAASLVSDPAIQVDWVALSKDQMKLMLSQDKTQYTLTGPMLIPNQKIYRIDAFGNGYEIFASVETIRLIAEKFAKGNYNNSTTLEHEVPLTGNTIMESWLIADTQNDKSSTLGYKLPVGTWMITVKINDVQFWDDFVATGIVKGFSLEGFFNHVDVAMLADEVKGENLSNTNINKSKITMIDKIKNILTSLTKTKVELEDAIAEVAMSDYTLEDGTVITVDDMGMANIVDPEGAIVGYIMVMMGPRPADVVTDPAQTGADAVPAQVTAEKVNEEVLSAITILAETVQGLQTELSAIKNAKGKAREGAEVEDKFSKVDTKVDLSLTQILTNRKTNKQK